MRATFHLIDLVFQWAALEGLLAGLSDVQKIDWLSAHGRLALVPKHEGPQVFHFTSTVGLETRFSLRNGLFVFLGDHTSAAPGDGCLHVSDESPLAYLVIIGITSWLAGMAIHGHQSQPAPRLRWRRKRRTKPMVGAFACLLA